MKKIITFLLLFTAVMAYGQRPLVDQVRYKAKTTAEMNALTGVQEGSTCFNTDTKTIWTYHTGIWNDTGAGGGTDDQTASEVAFTPYGTLQSTNTQSAIQELLDEAGGLNTVSDDPNPTLGGNLTLNGFDIPVSTSVQAALDAQDEANEIVFSPYLTITSTDVQGALNELKDEVDAGLGDGLGADGDKGDFTVTAGLASLDNDVVGAAEIVNGSIDAVELADNSIEESKLDAINTPTDGQIISWNTASGRYQYITQTGGGAPLLVQDETVTLTSNATKMNFEGNAVVATEPIADEILVTINETDDQTAAEVTYTNTTSGLTAVQVQAAIDEVEARVDLNDAKVTNTDAQDLTLTGNTLAISNDPNTDVDLSPYLDNTDSQNAAAVPVADAGANYTATDVEGVLAEIAPQLGTGESTTVGDTPEIDLTLTGSNITADLIAGSIDETKLDASTNASLDLADSALQAEVDGSTTNELQDLTIATNILSISQDPTPGATIDLSGYLDNTDAQTLSFTDPNLSITGGNSVDLSALKDGTGTDDQTAVEVPITDAGAIITATEVEGALQENRTAIDLNTAKVSNATHTGDVTGSTALTIAVDAVDIPMLSATGTADASTFLRGDNTWSVPAGAGDVSKVGTPVDNQVGVWTGDGTIEGAAGILHDGTNTGIGTIAPADFFQAQNVAKGSEGHIGFYMDTGAPTDDYSLNVDTSDTGLAYFSFEDGSGRTAVVMGGDTTNPAKTIFGVSNSTDSGTSWNPGIAVTFGGNTGLGKHTPTERLDIDGNIALTGTVDGRDIATDGTKLDGIEALATADQTGAEINALLTGADSVDDTNIADDTISASKLSMTNATLGAPEDGYVYTYDNASGGGTWEAQSGSGESTTVSDTAELDLTLTGSDISGVLVASSIDETKLDVSTNASLDLADSAVQTADIDTFAELNAIVADEGLVNLDDAQVLSNKSISSSSNTINFSGNVNLGTGTFYQGNVTSADVWTFDSTNEESPSLIIKSEDGGVGGTAIATYGLSGTGAPVSATDIVDKGYSDATYGGLASLNTWTSANIFALNSDTYFDDGAVSFTPNAAPGGNSLRQEFGVLNDNNFFFETGINTTFRLKLDPTVLTATRTLTAPDMSGALPVVSTDSNEQKISFAAGTTAQLDALPAPSAGEVRIEYPTDGDGVIEAEIVFTDQSWAQATFYELIPAPGAGKMLFPLSLQLVSKTTSVYTPGGVGTMDVIYNGETANPINVDGLWSTLDVAHTFVDYILLNNMGIKEWDSTQFANKSVGLYHGSGSNTGGTGTVTIRIKYRVIDL